MNIRTIGCAKCMWRDVCGCDDACNDFTPVEEYGCSEEDAYVMDLNMRGSISMITAKEQGYWD